MNLSSIEQETIINYNQGEAEATVFTYDKALIRKLERLREKNPAVDLLREEKTGAREYRFPKRWLKVVPRRGNRTKKTAGQSVFCDKLEPAGKSTKRHPHRKHP